MLHGAGCGAPMRYSVVWLSLRPTTPKAPIVSPSGGFFFRCRQRVIHLLAASVAYARMNPFIR